MMKYFLDGSISVLSVLVSEDVEFEDLSLVLNEFNILHN